MNKNSPFYIVKDFISPMMAEDIIDTLNVKEPDYDTENRPTKTTLFNGAIDDILFERLQQLIPDLEHHYGIEYKGTESPITYNLYPHGYEKEEYECENSSYINKKWMRTKSRDLSGVLFLNDYNESSNFSTTFEVYGGKLQFPQHSFGFNPERGCLVIFPSAPHFINGVSPVLYGDCYMIKLHITAKTPYLYDPNKFVGDYKTWFEDIA